MARENTDDDQLERNERNEFDFRKHARIRMERCVKISSQSTDYFSSFASTNIRRLNFYI